MSRTCTVCKHPKKGEIDAALVRGVSPYEIEAGYSGLAKSSIQRHQENGHIPNKLLKAQAVEEVTAADVLLEDVAAIRAAAFRALDAAEAAGDTNTLLRAIREARENVRLLGELRGQLNARVDARALISPAAMNVIVQILAPHPEIAEKVADALEPLEEIEHGNGS